MSAIRTEDGGMQCTIADFVRESNRIEGIHRDPTPAEIEATAKFVASGECPNITDLCALVSVLQPNAKPRFVQGLDVRVGNHLPPRGGPHIQGDLMHLLGEIGCGALNAYEGHSCYETLHPFTDGNGRSGRALWLWHMGGIAKAPLGFLHHWYYQSLQNSR